MFCAQHAMRMYVHSHGVLRTEHYVNRLLAGGINPGAQPVFKETGPVTGVLDGDDVHRHVAIHMTETIVSVKHPGHRPRFFKNRLCPRIDPSR